MTLFFYVILNVIALFLFTKKKKKLHILEIILYWMVSSYIFQNFSALCYMNFKTLIIPNKLNIELTHFLNRIILFPLLMVIFLDIFQIFNSYSKRILLFISSIFFFVGMEWLSDFFGVIVHVHWRIWWSFSFWLLTLSALLGFMKLFRKILYKGEKIS